MNIYILTHSPFKERELNRYFKDIGLPTIHLDLNTKAENLSGDYLLVTEQTQLISKITNTESLRNKFEPVIHYSELTLTISQNGEKAVKVYQGQIDGLLFPHLKTDRAELYSWDEMFVASNTMMSYQEMKDRGIKNSARDIAFSKMIDELPAIFKFDNKTNLNFNPVEKDEVISFEPIIEHLFKTNEYYQIAYKNEVFKPLIDSLLADGLFIRRASNRKQKNYWLPGLNAGIPLTPKKDELHELTFMFHDIMHFIFPDLIITNQDKKNKHKYFIARMISEAMTLILADILFISLLKDNHIEYDYTKRKIYPLFEKIKFDITKENLPKIKELLWANTQFALLGNDALERLVQNQEAFSVYQNKYQKIFQDDYVWTLQNYANMSKSSEENKKWLKLIQDNFGNILTSTEDFCPDFDERESRNEQVRKVFDVMYQKLEHMILNTSEFNREENKKIATYRYMAGQLYIFFKYETSYSQLFLQQIINSLKHDFEEAKNIYNAYIDKLNSDYFITSYEAQNYKNIYPFFQPYYVFYDRIKEETFHQTLIRLFEE